MDAASQICMVTGANVGIGRATAEVLARQGAHVVMVCRNRERGAPARAAIVEATGNERVDLLTADFASQQQVRACAAAFLEAYPRLDVLINNAGLYRSTFTETPEGIETTWAVNHLAPFLLTHLLLDVLRTSAPSRIINVTSASHYRSNGIDFDDPERRASYHYLEAYAQSKLANVLFTYELARRLEGTGVTANCIHPGTVATRIWNRNRHLAGFLVRLYKPFMIRPEKSAEAIARLATAPDLEKVSGRYFNLNEETRSSEASYDEAAAQRLWTLSASMTGL